MKASRKIALYALVMLVVLSCRERYEAEVAPGLTDVLVVEGQINPDGITKITLSRTLPLTNPDRMKPEPNAVVTIRGADNTEYPLQENANGVYLSDSILLNPGLTYQLRIRTSKGGEYLSAPVPVIYNPPIDSVHWKLKEDGVQIYVDTHNPQNNTRYYKWEYEETWEFHSSFEYGYRYVPEPMPTVVPREFSEIERLYFCWRTVPSSNILIGSSEHLTNDVISQAPIMFIPFDSEKTSVRYSIIVRQYALDRRAYDFYQQMRSNTESLGSIFDPLPSETTGNITCVSNPSEKVVGYITASAVQEQRIFIARTEIPSTHHNGCQTMYVDNHPDSLRKYLGPGQYAPYMAVGSAPAIKGYEASLTGCLDCTLRGTNVRPSFW